MERDLTKEFSYGSITRESVATEIQDYYGEDVEIEFNPHDITDEEMAQLANINGDAQNMSIDCSIDYVGEKYNKLLEKYVTVKEEQA